MARRPASQRPPDPAPSTGWRAWLRRVPSRLVLAVAVVLGGLGFLLCTIPFDTTSATGTTLECGPPLYEIVVPADPAFDVPENQGCAAPARQRVVLGGVIVGVALLAALVAELGSRQSTAYAQGRWLQGRRPRRSRARGAKGSRPRAGSAPPGQGSTSAATSSAKAAATAAVTGPGADGST